MAISDGRPFNHYVCQRCRQTTVTKHEDDGVTPFLLGCRATPGCNGTAQSSFYRGPQDPNQNVHGIWFRPKNAMALKKELLKFHRRFRAEMREHVEKGGCLLREMTVTPPQGDFGVH